MMNADLGKKVVNIRPVHRGSTKDGGLAGELVGAAQAIDLARVRTAEDVQKKAGQCLAILRDDAALQKHTLAGAASQQEVGHAGALPHRLRNAFQQSVL